MRISPKHNNFLLLAEAWGNDLRPLGSLAGYEFVYPDDTRACKLFTYKKANVRSYLDGHAEANDSTNLYWTAINQYDGNFTLTNNSQRNRSPWHRNWRNE